MTGLLFLSLLVLVAAWAFVFRSLLRSPDVRSARPVPISERRQVALEEAAKRMTKRLNAIQAAMRAIGGSAQEAAEAMHVFARSFPKYEDVVRTLERD